MINLESVRLDKLQSNFQTGHHRVNILLVSEVVGLDDWGGKRVRRAQSDHTSRLWPAHRLGILLPPDFIPEQGGGEGEGVLSHVRLPPRVDWVVWLEPHHALHHHPPVSGQAPRKHMELDIRSGVLSVLPLSPDKG